MYNPEPGFPHTPDGLTPDLASAPEPAIPEDDETGFAGLRDDIGTLVDDAKTYVEAEIAFQKTRVSVAGKKTGRVVVLLVLALVLLHIALIALAVGVVIALAPYVTIWGAIAIVVGVMLAGVAALLLSAKSESAVLSAMFGSGDEM